MDRFPSCSRFCISALFIFLPFHFSYSQSYHFKNYSAEDGLPFVQVYDIFQDSKGNLWTGGYGGLSRFDGKSFTNYAPKNGLANHWVTSITEDKDGNIWIGTITGLSRFDGRNFTTFTKEHGLTGDRITSLDCDRNGILWISTTEGITVYDGHRFSKFGKKNGLISENIHRVHADRNGNIWVSSDSGVSKITFPQRTPQDAGFDNFSIMNRMLDSVITTITEDGNGNLWFSNGNGLVKYDGAVFSPIHPFPDQSGNRVQSLAKGDKAEEIWIGTPHGLVKFSGDRMVSDYRVSDSKNGNNIASLLKDSEGNLWLGTSNGLYRFRDPSFTTFSDKDGLINPFVFPVFRDRKQNLWVGTFENGFYRYDNKSFQNFSQKDGLAGNKMFSGMQDRDGNILMGSDKGLTVYDGHSFRNFLGRNAGLHGDSVTAMLQDRKGRIWLGGNRGGSIWNGNRFRNFDLPTGTDNADIWYLFEDHQGFIWMGTYLGGLFRYDPKKDMGSPEKALEDMTAQLNLSSRTFLSVCEDTAGLLYLGSFEGLYIYNPVSGSVTTVNEKDGLSCDLIYVMAFDSAGDYLYIGTNQGINRFDARAFRETGEKIITQFGIEEGFSSLETNSNGIWRDADGTFWFGTVNGLIHFNPALSHYNIAEATTSIQTIRIFYSDTALADHARLPYYLNTLSFEYIGICLTNPEKVRYRYMLKGLDKTWSPETRETSARYPNLQPGTYTFMVMACNNEGIWNKEPVTFSFIITPPLWKTWWFRISFISLLVVLVSALVRMRINAVRKKESERLSREIEMAKNELKALRAQMDPHFIFNSLSSIQGYILSKDEESALRYLNKFAKLMRKILSNSEKTSLSLREEIETLSLYLELEKLRWDNRFTYTVEVDPVIDSDETSIPTMLIQPFVENAVIHGVIPRQDDQGKITISIRQTGAHLHCTISDNGIGRKRSRELRSESSRNMHESMGMKITTERLQVLNRMHGSSLDVTVTDLEDGKGQPSGTRVEIFIPV